MDNVVNRLTTLLIGQVVEKISIFDPCIGISRCPGLVSRVSLDDWSTIRNDEKIYVSINPVA